MFLWHPFSLLTVQQVLFSFRRNPSTRVPQPRLGPIPLWRCATHPIYSPVLISSLGVPFLIRIGLALISCLRRQILESTNDEAVLRMLHHMSPLALPPSPDSFITFTLSIKLKDDDIRKQRVKMEAQVKRQTQAPRLPSAGSISLPRS